MISFLEAPIAILALCAPAIGQVGTHVLQHRTYASLRSMFSTRKSKYKLGSNEGTHAVGQVEHYDKSQSTYRLNPVRQSQPARDWPPVPPGVGQNPTFANQSERMSDDSQASTAPTIPTGAIGVTRGVAVTYYQDSSMV